MKKWHRRVRIAKQLTELTLRRRFRTTNKNNSIRMKRIFLILTIAFLMNPIVDLEAYPYYRLFKGRLVSIVNEEMPETRYYGIEVDGEETYTVHLLDGTNPDYNIFPFLYGDQEYFENDSVEIGAGCFYLERKEIYVSYIKFINHPLTTMRGQLIRMPVPMFSEMPLVGAIYAIKVEDEMEFRISVGHEFFYEDWGKKKLIFEEEGFQVGDNVELVGYKFFRKNFFGVLFGEIEPVSLRKTGSGIGGPPPPDGVRLYLSESGRGLTLESEKDPLLSVRVVNPEGRVLYAEEYRGECRINIPLPDARGIFLIRMGLKSGRTLCKKWGM